MTPREWSAADSGDLRQAKVFDDQGSDGRSPNVSRPEVPAEEIDGVLRYLEQAPVVLAARGFDRDVLDPQGRSDVPLTFHTDGTWIWSGAVGYYLRVHAIAPEPDLLRHIRANGFRLPTVDDRARERAVTAITGAPPPETGAPDSAVTTAAAAPGATGGGTPMTTAEDQQRALAEQAREARVRAALRRLARRLNELRVDPAVYRLEALADETWCMVREDGRWAVFWYERGSRNQEASFQTADQAAAYLLGTLLIVPERMHPAGGPSGQETATPATPPTPEAVPEAPIPGGAAQPVVQQPSGSAGAIEPLPGEPPLTLFQELHQVQLPVGAQVDRFGDESGNLTYAVGTHYSNRSLPPEWATRGYHVYQVLRPLRALSGTAVPWFGQPGGGTAYLLPVAIEELLSAEWLIEVPGPGAPGGA